MMIFNDDCLTVMKKMKEKTVDMIYLDPPFYTQKTQKLYNSNGEKYEFYDTWESKTLYLKYISERLLAAYRVLKDTGSIFIHCDSTAGHYLKIELDKIFGEKNFRSEIIWTYKRWSNSKKGLLPAHQTIFFYSKTNKYKFNTIYCDYSPTTNLDQILQERERNDIGKAVYKKDSSGNIISSREKKGVPLSDVWDIPFLNPKAKERTGYPTQKPIELIERIIKITTDPGDTVLDPFCGSGTTLVGAKLLERRFIGIDINQDAIELTKKRLEQPFKTHSELLKKGITAYKTKTKAELEILHQIDCDIVQRNKGIDAFLKKHYLGAPVAVKIKREDETIDVAVNLLYTAAKKKGCSFSILILDEEPNHKFILPNNLILVYGYATQIRSKLQELALMP